MGGASAQTAGPSGNIDVPDISQASSDDLHDEVGWGLYLLLPPSFSISVLCGNDRAGVILKLHLIYINASSFK